MQSNCILQSVSQQCKCLNHNSNTLQRVFALTSLYYSISVVFCKQNYINKIAFVPIHQKRVSVAMKKGVITPYNCSMVVIHVLPKEREREREREREERERESQTLGYQGRYLAVNRVKTFMR